MLLVVFGAGASYDSDPARPPRRFPADSRPPLANQLFGNTRLYADAMSRFPQCRPILPRLQETARVGGSIELELERLQEEADAGDRERDTQLAALRHYLQYLLTDFTQEWIRTTGGVTNYLTFLDDIRRFRREEPVCLATFNYDTLLESALQAMRIPIQSLHDYVGRGDFKVIKLHGSIDWAREVETSIIRNAPERNIWEVTHEMIDSFSEIKDSVSNKYRIVRGTTSPPAPIPAPNRPVAANGVLVFPAIAVPFERKLDFECPQDHLEELRQMIRRVTKLLVIGWRATDQPFLEELRDRLKPGLRGKVVAGTRDSSRHVIEHLDANGITGDFEDFEGGFSEFILGRASEEFLRT